MVALNENLVYGTLQTYDIKVLILTLCAKFETMLIYPNEKIHMRFLLLQPGGVSELHLICLHVVVSLWLANRNTYHYNFDL